MAREEVSSVGKTGQQLDITYQRQDTTHPPLNRWDVTLNREYMPSQRNSRTGIQVQSFTDIIGNPGVPVEGMREEIEPDEENTFRQSTFINTGIVHDPPCEDATSLSSTRERNVYKK